MEYTAGVLDGDGCVRVDKRGVLCVCVKQAESGVGLLRWLERTYGGKVYRASKAVAQRQASFQWRLVGTQAGTFCKAVAGHTRLKRPQFVSAWRAPLLATSLRKDIADRLTELKKMPHGPFETVTVTDEYLAGILDTDGSLDAFPCTRVTVVQKHAALCEGLKAAFGGSVYKYKNRALYQWRVHGDTARSVLAKVSGLLQLKGPQARVILDAELCPRDKHQALKTLKRNPECI